LEAASVPCGPINNLQQVFTNEQVRARKICIDVPHPQLGSMPQIASPLRLSKSPVTYQNAAPSLGQHTETVLAELLNLASQQTAILRKKKVI